MAGTITHEWNGTILSITSDSGTTSCDLKGEKGDIGIRGVQGIPGEKGSQGEPGAPITYDDLTEEQKEALKGEPGDKGEPGEKGDNGISPIVKVNKVGTTTTLTITDAEGTKTAIIEDGVSNVASSIEWANITNKPETFDATPHEHSANDIVGLASVATTGSYTSLLDTPAIPTITTGTTELTAGTSTLATGAMYLQYE